jgi:nitrogen regulatory protein PII
MKKIEAFIRHEAFEPIRMELLDKGFPSLSISEVKGSGRQKGATAPDRIHCSVRAIAGLHVRRAAVSLTTEGMRG